MRKNREKELTNFVKVRRIFAIHIMKTERTEDMIFIRDWRESTKLFKL